MFIQPRDWEVGGFTVWRLDLGTGRKEPWRQFGPEDRVGLFGVGTVSVTPDGSAYFYHLNRILSDLFVVEGLK